MNYSPHNFADNQQDSGDALAGSGLVIIDKPAGMTSHDVVGRIRKIFRTRRVGHAGTLDPMATGVLVVGIERGTKFLAHMVAATKAYRATARLGAATTTDDAEGDLIEPQPEVAQRIAQLSDDEIRAACAAWCGQVSQIPAAVSAIKIDGKRAHQRVREGEDVEIPAREVTISRLEIHSIDRTDNSFIDVDFTVECSSGTYIRALARDIGADLGVGGHLTALRRTEVGPWNLADSRTLEELDDDARVPVQLDEALLRSYPAWQVTQDQAQSLSMGQRLARCGLVGVHAAQAPDGRAIALVTETPEYIKTVFVARPNTL